MVDGNASGANFRELSAGDSSKVYRGILEYDCVDRLEGTVVRGTEVCDIDAVGDSSITTLDQLPQGGLKLRGCNRSMFDSIHPTFSLRHEWSRAVSETI